MSTGSSTRESRESTGGAEHHWPHLFEQALELPRRSDDQRGWLNRSGISPRGERAFDILRPVVFLAFVAGWAWSLVNAQTGQNRESAPGPLERARAAIADALPTSGAPKVAYL